MDKHVLRVKILDTCPNKDFVKEYYLKKVSNISYNGDSGVDIVFPEDVTFETSRVTTCGLGIACELIPSGKTESGPFELFPRSSICNTPLALANSIGLFDKGYRGEVIAKLRCSIDKGHPSTMDEFVYNVKKGDRLLQIVAPDREPIYVQVVDQLSSTERGSNGFGSTNSRQV